ncbi:uncharacterized protein LOC129243683 [Anastrepha obliqua]|uniref:uncharacterized protein LOC129243683 n=1 Tax=Anastrepha obliqua TaxID=95512 RepID=UPI0024094215|nr:uncharacterized protein LOC129243683 [Anastrepha obliqua]XP_054736861.1 uncharacterized protein LOC129243683 [Anastrepha obliqua]
MSFSPKVLANIKQAIDSDEDEYDIIKTFPEATTAIEPIVEILPRCKDFKEELDANVDPLLGNVEKFVQNSFVGTYQDTEILKTDESDDNEDNATSRHSKRKRLEDELKGRNGYTWSTNKAAATTDASFDSALEFLQPKGKGPAHTINNILEMWSLLLDEQIVSQIVHHTNVAIKERKVKLPHQRLIDAVELRAWIGLTYLCGIFRNATHNGPLDELWSLELGNAIFRATMSLKRFRFILECMRFGENSKQGKTQQSQAVIDIWNKFIVNCRSYYAPSGNCSVGEVLMNFTNINDAPRLLMICDVKTLYMCNAVLNPAGDDYRDRDVLRLVSDIKGSKRNIVLPSHLTSIELTNKLLDMDLSALGILPYTAKEMPQELTSNSTIRKLYSKSANLICSQQNLGILLTSGIPNRIKVEHLYSLSCNTSRSYQEKVCMYSTSHAAQPNQDCWALNFFQNILDYAAVNAWILFVLSSNSDGSMKQRDFQRHLGLYLTQQQLKRQLHSNRLTLPQKIQISDVLGEPIDQLFASVTTGTTNDSIIASIPNEKLKLPDGVKLMPKNLKTRTRCRKCPSKVSRKTKTRCQQCLRPLCQKHFILRCRDCTGVPEMETSADVEEAEPVLSESDGEQGQDDNDLLNFE